MLEEFDYSVLDDPNFKEDAVREEIIAPLLKQLGYGLTGENRVVRSKTLTHPFVKIGTRQLPVRIIPDYTLYHKDTPILILDAKGPSEQIVNSSNVEQAYSYSIHPEIRSKHFALCNGRALALYDVDVAEPVLLMPIQEWKEKWRLIAQHFEPRYLLNPQFREFHPDAGICVARLGLKPGASITFLDLHLQILGKVSDDLYSMSSAFEFPGGPHVGSFDFPALLLDPILSCLARPLEDGVRAALARSPFQASLDLMLAVDCVTHLGFPTEGEHDVFIPFIVDEILGRRFDRSPKPLQKDIPSYMFSLRKTFDELKSAQ